MSEDVSIAKIIDPSGPQLWLIVAVAKFGATLNCTIKCEQKYTGRTELLGRLQTLGDAIETVRAAMRDERMLTLLIGDAQLHNQNETYHGLADLSDRVKKTLGELPRGKGKHKFFGNEGATPRQICALMVMTLWERVRPASATPDSKEAQRACQQLWAAAGGQLGWSNRDNPSITTWRDHLRAAKTLQNSKEAAFLNRSLNAIVAMKVATPLKAELIYDPDAAIYRLSRLEP